MQEGLDITGLGLVTPLGTAPWPTFAALLKGRTTADRLAEVPEEVDPTVLASATGGSARARFSPVDPAVEIAERAARDALFEAFPEGHPPQLRTIVASSKGAVMGLLQTLDPRRAGGVPHDAAALGPHGWLCAQLRTRLGLGTTTAVVAACATAVAALHQARRELETGEADAILLIAVESALHPVFVESYRRLGVLAPVEPPSAHVARPLDRGRAGFTLNESGAAMVLQRPGRHGRPLARLVNTAFAAQPEDLVRPGERFDTLERLVARVAGEGAVAAVHPHAPGTPANDEAELRAIARGLGKRRAPAYAVKGAIGHSLGASGLVSAAVAVAAGRARRLPPMPWIREPLDALPIHPEGVAIDAGRHVITAAGFGGHVGAVAIEVP